MELHSSTILLLALLFLPVVLIIFFQKRSVITKPTSLGLKHYPILAMLPQFIKNRHRYLEWITEVLAGSPSQTIAIHIPRDLGGVIITANPANVEHMLKTRFENYPHGEGIKEAATDLLGLTVVTLDGEAWRMHRNAISYEFNKRSLKNFILENVKFEIVNRLLPLFKKFENKDKIIDLQDVLQRFGFDNICKVAFNEDPACLSEEAMTIDTESTKFVKAFDEAQNITMARAMSPFKLVWKIKKLLNIGSERCMRESMSVVHRYIMTIVQARKEKLSLDEYHDLLSSFLANKQISDELLRDSAKNLILAGRETSSSALTWFFWIISTRPDVKAKIVEEIRKIRALNQITNDIFSFDCLREMHYIHAAITESMRLYPPLPFNMQFCLKDDKFPDETSVRKGWYMIHSAYAMARMETIWGEDCKEYKPERWLEDGVFRPESPYRYPIFHAGPRMCLGKEMAYIQMKLIVASVIENFEYNVVEKEGTPDYFYSSTMRMKGGLPVKLHSN